MQIRSTPYLLIGIIALSLFTIMSGAAVAPALGEISNHFVGTSPFMIRMIISLPPVFVILTTYYFEFLTERVSVKMLLIIGLILYGGGGILGGAVDNIWILLFFRMIHGIGLGLIMPFSTSLIFHFFKKDSHMRFLGISSAMNNLGAIVAMLITGFLSYYSWRYSFIVYFIAFVELLLISVFFPGDFQLDKRKALKKKANDQTRPYLIGIFLTMLVFYSVPTNFSMITLKVSNINVGMIGFLMSLQTLSAFIVGLNYNFCHSLFKHSTEKVGVISMSLGFVVLTMSNQMYLVTLGLIMIGISTGILIPYFNSTVLSRISKEDTTVTMAKMSMMFYLGQFLSPIMIELIHSILKFSSIKYPYIISLLMSLFMYKNILNPGYE